jgi:hypothetical protein
VPALPPGSPTRAGASNSISGRSGGSERSACRPACGGCRLGSGNVYTAVPILQSTSTRIRVLYKSLKTRRRGFDHSSSPSASYATRYTLFPASSNRRKPAECAALRLFVRTGRRGRKAPSGHFPSLSPHFLRRNRTTAVLVRISEARQRKELRAGQGGEGLKELRSAKSTGIEHLDLLRILCREATSSRRRASPNCSANSCRRPARHSGPQWCRALSRHPLCDTVAPSGESAEAHASNLFPR